MNFPGNFSKSYLVNLLASFSMLYAVQYILKYSCDAFFKKLPSSLLQLDFTRFVKKLLLFISLFFSVSCSFANQKTADLAIYSNPRGADIVINGRNFGRTPKILKLTPAELRIFLYMPGFKRAEIKTSYYGSVRTDVNGNVTADGKRCLADAATIIFFFTSFTDYCSDFKQKSYYIELEPETYR